MKDQCQGLLVSSVCLLGLEMDSAESDKIRLTFKAEEAHPHWQEEQLGLVHQQMLEAAKCNASACATWSDKLNFIIDQRQISEQPSASPLASFRSFG